MFAKLDRVLRLTIHALFLILLFCLPLILWIPASEVFELPKMLFVYLMTALIVGMWMIRMILAGRIILRRTPLDIPILLFLVSQIASTIYSIDPHISWFGWYGRFHGGLLSTISYTLLYFALTSNLGSDSKWENRSEKLDDEVGSEKLHFQPRYLASHLPFLTSLASATIVSLYAIFQHFGIDKDFWIQDVVNRVFSTQGQPNWLAAYLVMVMPLGWAIILAKEEGRRKKEEGLGTTAFYLLPFTFCLILSLALLWTKSRSGLLGFAVTDITFWVITLVIPCLTRNLYRFQHKAGMTMYFKQFLLIHLIILSLVFIVDNPARDWLFRTIQPVKNQSEQSAINNQQLTINNLRKSELGGTESGDIRRIVWNGAAELIKQRPFFGFGPETFGLTYWRVRPKEANLTSEWNFLYNKAHNEWLNLAANTGFLGLGAHLLLLGWFFVFAIRYSLNDNRKEKVRLTINDSRLTVAALLAAILGVEAVNFFGFSTVTIGAYRYLFMAMAVMSGNRDQRTEIREQRERLPFTVYCLLFTVFLAVLYLPSRISSLFSADLKYNLGRQFNNTGYAAEALGPLSEAVNLAPNEPVFRNELAESLSSAAISVWAAGNQNQAIDIKNEAVQHFKIISAKSKLNLTFVRTQAQMEFLMREVDPELTDEALLLAQKAIDLSPADPRGYYLLGRMYEELGDKIRAEKLYRQALELKPDYEEAKEKLKTL